MFSLILASQSPRRQQLLRLIRETFLVSAADVAEIQQNGESPQEYVVRMSQLKAITVGKQLKNRKDLDLAVLAADTTVVNQGEVVGKPTDPREAIEILQRLQGNSHQVYSGACLYLPGSEHLAAKLAASEVSMRTLEKQEIKEYVATGDPLDKAGAYAIQNEQFTLVENFQDCFANVMGLPLCHIKLLFDDMGLDCPDDVPQRCQSALSYDCPVYQIILRKQE